MQTQQIWISTSDGEDIPNLKEVVFSQLNKIKKLPNFSIVRNNKGITYLNIPVSFDIETSSWSQGTIKHAIMYIWTFNIDGITFIGRTWDQFTALLNLISKFFVLSSNNRMLVYVHNLDYEFQFMRKWIDWLTVFADTPRKIFYALTKNGIEFRCSYRLSGYKLALLPNELTEYKTQKMVGDLDYSKLRTRKTPLTDVELKYCTQDTQVVVCYIQEEIDKNKNNISQIPLTKTGYVRRYCRDKCLKDTSSKEAIRACLNYRRLMSTLTLDYDEYVIMKKAFMGGFTHANVEHVMDIMQNVDSDDFTSSYPGVCVRQYMPMSKPQKVCPTYPEEFENYINTKCCVFDVEFRNIQCVARFENYISESKCWDLEGWHTNNGRIISAEKLKITITELDYQIIKALYNWTDIKIGDFYIMDRGFLPKSLVVSILDLYEMKTKLKGVEGKEKEYLLSKGMLNSTYGMMVTDIIRDDLTYSNNTSGSGWGTTSSMSSQLNNYNRNQGRFLYYPWGVWVTAHARYNLFTGIMELGSDYIYSDTDSVKYINREKHIEYFKKYNEKVRKENMEMSIRYGIPIEKFSPKTVKGKVKTIGEWDYEGQYKRFKTLGAKRYLLEEQNGDLMFTVAGVPKAAIKSYMEREYIDNDSIFENFNTFLQIPEGEAGKLTHTYIDTEFSDRIRDYQGVWCDYDEKSAINLSPASFSLSIIDEFWDYIKGVKVVEQ